MCCALGEENSTSDQIHRGFTNKVKFLRRRWTPGSTYLQVSYSVSQLDYSPLHKYVNASWREQRFCHPLILWPLPAILLRKPDVIIHQNIRYYHLQLEVNQKSPRASVSPMTERQVIRPSRYKTSAAPFDSPSSPSTAILRARLNLHGSYLMASS